jgi:hypothetical protein
MAPAAGSLAPPRRQRRQGLLFQYLDFLMRRPEGLTIDEMGSMNELFLIPEHFVQLCRLRAGRSDLVNL